MLVAILMRPHEWDIVVDVLSCGGMAHLGVEGEDGQRPLLDPLRGPYADDARVQHGGDSGQPILSSRKGSGHAGVVVAGGKAILLNRLPIVILELSNQSAGAVPEGFLTEIDELDKTLALVVEDVLLVGRQVFVGSTGVPGSGGAGVVHNDFPRNVTNVALARQLEMLSVVPTVPVLDLGTDDLANVLLGADLAAHSSVLDCSFQFTL